MLPRGANDIHLSRTAERSWQTLMHAAIVWEPALHKADALIRRHIASFAREITLLHCVQIMTSRITAKYRMTNKISQVLSQHNA